uniref:BRX domain-containing protein n=1 Tax=Leersia perrieri TaxID=77586 RepID=A0A0D9W1I9_9ORYZ
MVLKLSGTHRHQHGHQRRGGSPPPARGRTTSVYRSGYYRPGMVQDDMAVPPATYLGGGSASSTPAWDFSRPAEGEAREWVAQVEPGVQITFVSLAAGAGGGNDLKRIRFSREMYDKWQAQKWWGENNERIMELYNVRRFSRQVLPTPPRSDDGERESFYSQSQVGSTRESPAATPSPAPLTPDRVTSWSAFVRPPSAPRNQQQQHSFRPMSPPPPSSSNPSERAWHQQQQQQNQQQRAGKSPAASDGMEAARTTSCSSRDEVSISNASELEVTEWVIQDEPGVYITVRELADGSRELRRVRFSRERFAELNAKLWWEENKERIQTQYL